VGIELVNITTPVRTRKLAVVKVLNASISRKAICAIVSAELTKDFPVKAPTIIA
jgi:hypothetical protein